MPCMGEVLDERSPFWGRLEFVVLGLSRKTEVRANTDVLKKRAGAEAWQVSECVSCKPGGRWVTVVQLVSNTGYLSRVAAEEECCRFVEARKNDLPFPEWVRWPCRPGGLVISDSERRMFAGVGEFVGDICEGVM